MSTFRTIAFHTLGCKLNFSETSSIERMCSDAGYEITDYHLPADIYVLNTCSVTEEADKKCRYSVRSFLRRNPSAKIIVIGCYAQLKPVEISQIPGVSIVLGAAEKFQLVEVLNKLSESTSGLMEVGPVHHANSFVPSYSLESRTRTFLKVQDGCDYKCSFCTIPQARGKSRSGTVSELVQLANTISIQGAKEIVLTGVNIGDFGNGTEIIEQQIPKKQELFVDLILALDRETTVDRYRISSIEPNLCTEEIIDFVANSRRFMPHFHIPLQSGDNEILARMKRRYKRELYQTRVEQIRRRMPHACIGVDVIVGFPGETEEHFMNTYRFIQDLDVSYLHVFTYSERKNTAAAEMEGSVSPKKRSDRNEMLRILSEKKKRAFASSQLGTTRPVLWEQSDESGKIFGWTDNYCSVETTVGGNRSTNLISEENLQYLSPSGTIILS